MPLALADDGLDDRNEVGQCLNTGNGRIAFEPPGLDSEEIAKERFLYTA